jgi:uncharacterized damage-inducible protein DinB
MLTKIQFQTLFAYHWHTTNHLLDLAAQLDEADYKAPTGYGKGSMLDIFFHLVRALNNWRQGLETGKRLYLLNSEDYTTLEAVRAGFQKEQSAWQSLLDNLSEEDFDGEINFTRHSGEVENYPRWRVLMHLMLHGMQHQAELAELLTRKGHSPGDIDFIFFK